jgi:hypothetical protein
MMAPPVLICVATRMMYGRRSECTGLCGLCQRSQLSGVCSFHGYVVEPDVGSMIARQGTSGVGCLPVTDGCRVSSTIYQGGQW